MIKQNNIGILKRTLFIVIFSSVLLFPLFSPICCSIDPPHEYYFENVNVMVIGRCRSIGSCGAPWSGGLYQGNLSGADACTDGTWLERMNVVVYNSSLSDIYQKFVRLTNHIVFMRNVSGILFWGAKGMGVRYIPPVIFIRCHADQLWIRDAEWEPGNLSSLNMANMFYYDTE